MTTIVEPSVGEMFYGLGLFFVFSGIAYIIFVYAKMVSRNADIENEYSDTETAALKEFVQRKKPLVHKVKELFVAERRKKSFRNRLEEELIRDYFEEKKKY